MKPSQLKTVLRKPLISLMALSLSIPVTGFSKDRSDFPAARDLVDNEIDWVGTSSIFTLTEAQKFALRFIYDGALRAEVGIANYAVYDKSVLEFLESIQSHFQSLPSEMKEVMKGLDYGSNSAVQGALIEDGFHPALAYAAEFLLVGPGDENGTNAGSLKDHVIARMVQQRGHKLESDRLSAMSDELSATHYRVPADFTIEFDNFESEVRRAFQEESLSRSFSLDSDGRPLDLDPQLENIMMFVVDYQQQVLAIRNNPTEGFFKNARDHFYSLKRRYAELWRVSQVIQTIVFDLQGAIDSVKYKMAMDETDTAREYNALREVLDDLLSSKEEFAGLVGDLAQLTPDIENQTLVPVSRKLRKAIEAIENFRVYLTPDLANKVEKMDVIMGFHLDEMRKVQFDTPWELAFQDFQQQATLAGFWGKWQSIRTFQILVYEEYKTAHWTTEEEVEYTTTDSDGNESTHTRTETRHHYSSETNYEHETVHTPSEEMKFASEIEELDQQLTRLQKGKAEGSERKVGELIEKIKSTKTRHAKLLEIPPRGKDESEHRIPRLRNQQNQFRALLTRANVLSTSISRNLEVFDRNPDPTLNEVSASAIEHFAELDKIQNQRMKTIGIVTGSVAVVAGGCAALFGEEISDFARSLADSLGHYPKRGDL